MRYYDSMAKRHCDKASLMNVDDATQFLKEQVDGRAYKYSVSLRTVLKNYCPELLDRVFNAKSN